MRKNLLTIAILFASICIYGKAIEVGFDKAKAKGEIGCNPNKINVWKQGGEVALDLTVDTAGEYNLVLDYSSGMPGGTIGIKLDDGEMLEKQISGTGGWNKHQDFVIEKTYKLEAGTHRLTLKSLKSTGQFFVDVFGIKFISTDSATVDKDAVKQTVKEAVNNKVVVLSGEAVSPESLYIKKETWAATMVATRQRLKQGYQLDLRVGPWYMTSPVKVGSMDELGYPETPIDYTLKSNDLTPVWTCRSDWKDGAIINITFQQRKEVRYLSRKIFSEKPQKKTLFFGYDDGVELWLNGKHVLKKTGQTWCRLKQKTKLDLKAGENLLVWKVYNQHSRSDFGFRLEGLEPVNNPLMSKLSRIFWRDFPRETDWWMQDLGGNMADWELGGFDGKKDLERYMLGERDAQLEQSALTKVLKDLGSQGNALKKELSTLSGKNTAPDSPAWLELYVRACAERRLIRLQPLLKKTSKLLFAKHQELATGPGVPNIYHITENERAWQPSGFYELDLTPETVANGAFAKETLLIDAGKDGMIRDLNLHWDAKRVLFTWKKEVDPKTGKRLPTPKAAYQVYEKNLQNGEIRQLTDETTYGASFDACYLPNDDIIFNSARIVQVVTCGFGDTSNLFIMNKDGKYARRVGFDQVSDSFPSVMADGQVLYTRRDYNDRGQIYTHPLFLMNTDGSNQRAFYGMHTIEPTTMQHTATIPGSRKVMAILGGYHTSQGGKLATIDISKGRNGYDGLRQFSGEELPRMKYTNDDTYGREGDQYSYPYPLSEEFTLVSYDPIGFNSLGKGYRNKGGESQWGHYKVYAMGADGSRELLAADPEVPCMEPVPVIARKRPAVRPSTLDYKKKDGILYVQDIYQGKALKGVARGTVKKLRVVEMKYKPETIGASPMGSIGKLGVDSGGWGHTVTPTGVASAAYDARAILGSATVYEDGSAFFKVPARTPIYLQALDEKGKAIQTERSWLTLMPGETLSCVGCHDDKNQTPVQTGKSSIALKHGVESLSPFYGPARGFNYRQEVQPIWDKHCISCHAPGKEDAKFDLTDTAVHGVNRSAKVDPKAIRRPNNSLRRFSQSYLTLLQSTYDEKRNQLSPGKPNALVNYYHRLTIPTEKGAYYTGSTQSKLLTMLEEGHKQVKLNTEELEKIAAWIDLSVPFVGDYDADNVWTPAEQKKYDDRIKLRRKMEAIDRENIKQFIKDGQPTLPSQNTFIAPITDKEASDTTSLHKQPRLLVASYSQGAAFILSSDNKVEWKYKMPGFCQDAWRLPNGNILLSGKNIVREVTLDKKIVWEYKPNVEIKTEIHSCQPLANGNALIAESGTCRLLEVDRSGSIVREIKLDLKGNSHSHTRTVRMREDGSFTVTAIGQGSVIDFDKDANPVWSIKQNIMREQGVRWGGVHSFVRLANGNTLIAGGHGPNLAEVTPDKKVVWKFTKDDAPELGLKYSAGFQVLDDNVIIMSAYDSGVQLFAIDKASKKVLWTVKNKEIGRPTHVMVLDQTIDPQPWKLKR